MLAEAACTGKVFPKVEIHVTASYTEADRQPYYRYELTNVRVTSYSVNGSGSGGNDRPVETITLNFAAVKVEYDQKGLKHKWYSKGASKGNVETSHKVGKGEK